MTLEEAIKHCLSIAEKGKECAGTELYECGKDFQQLAEWLTELKELKALVAGYNPAGIQTLEMLLAMMRNQNNNDTNLCELCDKEVELKEAKRLLKAAVEDMNSNNICCDINAVNHCISCDTFHWRYTDEAEKLIGGGENG